MALDRDDLIEHLWRAHHVDQDVAENVIGGAVGESYPRGFHDGLHGRIDADDLKEHKP